MVTAKTENIKTKEGEEKKKLKNHQNRIALAPSKDKC